VYRKVGFTSCTQNSLSVSRLGEKLCISNVENFFSTKIVILSLYRIVENLQHGEMSLSTS
jgi:hypothetical protein